MHGNHSNGSDAPYKAVAEAHIRVAAALGAALASRAPGADHVRDRAVLRAGAILEADRCPLPDLHKHSTHP